MDLQLLVIQPVTHCIFDMDGLLLDTERIYSLAISAITEKYGHEFTWELKEKTLGLYVRRTAKLLIDELNLPITVDEFVSEWEKMCKKMLPFAEFLPGVKKLLLHLKHHNIPFAIGTSSTRQNLKLKFSRHTEFLELFQHVVVGTDVTNGKPAPDIFLKCAGMFDPKPRPAKCLVFEDSPNGVKAAVSAGMQVVLVPDERMNPKMYAGATMVIPSMEDFQPELFGLPPFDYEDNEA